MPASPYSIDDPSALLSPSLVIFRDLVERNVKTMIQIAGGPARLRPHLKTHKMAEIIQLLEKRGIHKHKCATIAEAQMAAEAGATDVLLAYPLVGPNLARFVNLIKTYPQTRFRVVVDHPDPARALAGAAEGLGSPISTLVDLDVGMGRTGIDPGGQAAELYRLISQLPTLTADGLHAYDGHVHDTDLTARREVVTQGQRLTFALRDRLVGEGLAVPRIVFGGTPSFPIHAELTDPTVECSPGTIVFHDHGYATRYPDLPFTPAALLLTRVISHPRPGRLTLDLGHKAVAADPVGPRLHLIDLPDAKIVGQSEEHLVVETPLAHDFPVGTWMLAIPTHICPSVALHRRAYVITEGRLAGEWDVTARDRFLGI